MNEKRVAIVTGGSRGIGAAIVSGWRRTACTSSRSRATLDKLQEVVRRR